MPSRRVTVSLPAEYLRVIDRLEKDRGRFILDAIRRELLRRRRVDLRISLRTPHAESRKYSELGFDAWAKSLPQEDISRLVDIRSARAIRWVHGKGWIEGRR